MQAILHCDSFWGIGKNNSLMFRLPKDMKFFREMTSGKVVVMGWKTLLSFPQSKPLKNRTNIVLSKNPNNVFPNEENLVIVRSLDELFAEIKKYDTDNVFVIGGAMMYHTLLPYCSKVYLTKVEANGEAEVFFDNLDKLDNWKMVQCSDSIDDNGYTIRFTVYANNNVKEF